jgi:CHASE3 domain sensor protein
VPSPLESSSGRWLAYLPPLLLVGLVLLSIVLFRRADEGRQEVHRIERVRLLTVRAFSDLQDAETGERGYLLHGDESYLVPFYSGRDSVLQRIQLLKRLTQSEPAQERLLDQLAPLIGRRIGRLEAAIETRRSQGSSAAAAVVSSGAGRQLMDSARTLFAQMRREENRLMMLAEDREQKDQRRLQIALVVGAILSAIVSLVVSNKLQNDAIRHWLMSAELNARIEMQRIQAGSSPPTTPTSNQTIR